MAFKRRTLGRFRWVVLDSAGAPISSASVEIRRQGATVIAPPATGNSGDPVSVDEVGAIEATDSITHWDGTTETAGFTAGTVTHASETAGFSISLTGAGWSVTDNDRLTPTNSLPTLYDDNKSSSDTTGNPLTTDANGAVVCWLPQGFYDVKESGTGVTTMIHYDVFVGGDDVVLDFTEARYGCQFDGLTDDGDGILKALADAAIILAATPDVKSARVQGPKGIAITNQKITVPDGVELCGEGGKSTVIEAGGSFVGTDLVQFGDGTNPSKATMIRSIGFDCSGIASSKGIVSTKASDGSLIEDVFVDDYKGTGIEFTTSGCNDWTVRNVVLQHTSTTAIGIEANASLGRCKIQGAVVKASASAHSTNQALKLTSSNVSVRDVSMDHFTVGVDCVSGGGTVVGVGWLGQSGTTMADVVKIQAAGWSVLDIDQNGATNGVNDTVTGDAVSLGEGGYFFHTNDSVPGIWSSDGTVANVVNNPVTFTDNVTLNASTIMGPRVDVASSGTITLSAGTFFRLTGSTGVNNITAGTAGRFVVLMGPSSGTVTVNNTNNIFLLTGGGPALDSDDVLTMISDGTNWYRINGSDNRA